ncbi:ribonuclease Y [Candidatus Nomurabacteria bacterium]|uniref:Ribonuclease Y n=1 Tax=candidate division WWE3 bacterium TaxID=2053526 RepID=A0A955IW24_UNCKA|nr:ribonuclease Y [candidate division WWE3 bacterium]MCB9824173.1 ribonuclease Y [Candidatus Nomurabacteria bacterium]MCB9826856.1 ribonuclease Y [Candidatus Nomurabacteria bacterium]MCB9828114.1 ribonuclease Y [Candidatus Nomurabacteria bacterium]
MQSIILILAVLSSFGLGIKAYQYYSVKQKKQGIDDSAESKKLEPGLDNQDSSQDSDKPSLVSEARAKAREIILEAKDSSLQIKKEAQDYAMKVKQALELKERELVKKEAAVEVKEKEIENRQNELKSDREEVQKKLDNLASLESEQQSKLAKIASLTREEAREQLLKVFDKELAVEKSKRIREVEEEIKRDSVEKAQEILVDAMRFGATDYVVAHTTSKVKLPDEDIKGRIIGKEGRNIRTFEEYTGVELDLDSSPGEIIVSSFDPIRREIAKVSLERLIADGRIQPSRIEEIVEKTTKEIEHIMYKEGDNLCHRVGVYNIPKDLVQMLGRFKYRFSYGQNMIEHTLEETRIGVAIANELKVDVEVVKLGCLFHDIGKVVNDEEGTHVQLGVDLLKKHKIDERVINCVAEHHEDRPFSSIESAIVALADHVSGARPGARSEDYEAYVQRMKALEEAAMSFDGVEKSFAISAGRELRIFVTPSKVDDDSTALLAREIAKKIELEQSYPGVVKVTVIRETRFTETAK